MIECAAPAVHLRFRRAGYSSSCLLYLSPEGCLVLTTTRDLTPPTTNTLAAAVHFSALARTQSKAPCSPKGKEKHVRGTCVAHGNEPFAAGSGGLQPLNQT